MKNLWIKFLLVILSIFITDNIYASEGKLMSNIQVKYQILVAIEGLKGMLPMQVDEFNTTLFKIKPFGVRGVEMFYRKDTTKDEYEEYEARAIHELYLKKLQIHNYCNNTTLIWYRNEFVEQKWTYLDKNDEHLLSIRGNPNDCPCCL